MNEKCRQAKEVIRRLGGNAKTALLCDISRGAVSQWLQNGIPKTQLRYIKAVRPDVFQEEIKLLGWSQPPK